MAPEAKGPKEQRDEVSDNGQDAGLMARMQEVNPDLHAAVIKAREKRKRREGTDALHVRAAGEGDPLDRLPKQVQALIEQLAVLQEEFDSIKRTLQKVEALPADMQHLKQRVDRAGRFVGDLVKVNRLKAPAEKKK
jgi:hypothetical protein